MHLLPRTAWSLPWLGNSCEHTQAPCTPTGQPRAKDAEKPLGGEQANAQVVCTEVLRAPQSAKAVTVWEYSLPVARRCRGQGAHAPTCRVAQPCTHSLWKSQKTGSAPRG